MLLNAEQTEGVLAEVMGERARQDEKWGPQEHSPVEWISILGEEFGEASRGANESHWGPSTTASLAEYRKEMLEVAAVAVAAVEALDRWKESDNG